MNTFFTDKQLIKSILDFLGSEKSFILITGTGCSGKTTLSLKMASIIETSGKMVSCIHMDDFLTSSVVRNASIKSWKMGDMEFKGRYTSCCPESYYVAAVESVLFALNNGASQYVKTKSGTYDLIGSHAHLTIIEGLGVPFIPSISGGLRIFLECSEEIEMQRRLKRDSVRLNKTAEEIISDSIDRRNQYQKYILPYKGCCELVLRSNVDFTFSKVSDKLGILT